MYTGIVKSTSEVVEINKKLGLWNIALNFPTFLLKDLSIGASVSIDGVCLTVVKINDNHVYFDAMIETLEKTTLGQLEIGNKVNIERSAKQGEEVGGHILSGHIEGMGKIIKIDSSDNNFIVDFSFPNEWKDFIFHKGFIGINGASLTVVKNTTENEFSVYFIPETLRATTFSDKKVGDLVNIEIDYQTKVIVETVKNYLNNIHH